MQTAGGRSGGTGRAPQDVLDRHPGVDGGYWGHQLGKRAQHIDAESERWRIAARPAVAEEERRDRLRVDFSERATGIDTAALDMEAGHIERRHGAEIGWPERR